MKNIYSIHIWLLFIGLSILLNSCKAPFIEPSETCVNDTDFIVNLNHPKAADIQAIMDIYISRGVPGITILIHDDNGFWIGAAGHADIENDIAMEACHINKLGSVTKMMIGSLVWQLIQDGVLNIDDPISKYLPEVANRIENGNEISLAMLMRHSSGIYDFAGDLDYNLAVINDFDKSWSQEEILDYLVGKPATHLPDEKIRYSNSNTLLTSMIVEAATGENQMDLMKERIFDPLGMDQTVYFDYSEKFPFSNLAQGYLDFNNDGGAIQNISNLNPGSGNGFTGVYSTVTDLYRFANALLRGKTLTSPENLEEIFNSFRFTESGTWGSSIGAIHDEYRKVLDENIHAYGHAGGDIGYSANLNYLPHNNTIMAVTYNYGTNLPSDLGREVNDSRAEFILVAAE